jgi:hypothetical protein
MIAPTFAGSYSSVYTTSTSTKNVSVTTQAGDIVVVYGGGENQTVTLSTPTGNSLNFTLQQSVVTTSYASAYLWTATDSTGGTNWTLSCTSSGSGQWGFTCYVFRGSIGIGASGKANVATSAPTLTFSTTSNYSALVVFDSDWNAQNGSTRTWRTVNSITPSFGNGYETDYVFSSGVWTAYGAYYPNAGVAGSVNVGLTTPSNQTWSLVAVEVLGGPSPKIATLTEDFSGGSMDSSKWGLLTGGGSSSQSTGQLVISPLSNSPAYEGYYSLLTYDLTNSAIYVANIQGLSTDLGAETLLSLQYGSSANAIMIVSTQSGYTMRIRTSNVNDDTSFTPRNDTANRWWRIREKYGNIYWDTSPDCINWTNRRIAAPTFAITDLNVTVAAGTWQNVASPGQAIFDTINTYGVQSLPVGWVKGS